MSARTGGAGGASGLARFAAGFERSADRVPAHPRDILLGLEDQPPALQTVALALQHVAIQSIYFVLPALVSSAFGIAPLEATNFLCLSLLALGLSTALQAVTRGPIGSGYALPTIPSVIMLAPYLLAARTGHDLATASAMIVMVGIVTVALAPMVRRLSALMPTEVMGIVVFLIGASFVPSVLTMVGADASRPRDALPQMAIAFGCFAIMVIAGVPRWRVAPYAVLIGAVAGTAGALLLGFGREGSAALLAEAPWFAVPHPAVHGRPSFDLSLAVSFLLCTVAAVASLIGTLVLFQRAIDGEWTRTDPGPLRRGMLAHGIAVAAAGLLGTMPASSSSASVGVSIATRTFARVIALVGAAMVCALAFSPKLAALFVLVPTPVQAAMLLYVAGFMMAQGCQMAVTRTLDTRRTIVAGLGLSSGIAALAAPAFFTAAVPALAAPLAVGGLVSFVANLVTLPLIRREERFTVPLGTGASDLLGDEAVKVGGAWGLRPETVRKVHHALIELCDLLAGRGIKQMSVSAAQHDERVRIAVAFAGPPLPRMLRRPTAADIEAGGDALEMTALWLALREASEHGTRTTASGQELWMEFDD